MTTELVDEVTGEIVEPIERAEAERLTTRIRLRLDTIADNYVAVMPLIREAIQRQAWQVLGYSGVSEYVSQCFGDALAHLGVDVRREVVRELTAAGMSTRAIAPVVGVSQSTIRDDIKVTQVSTTYSPEPPLAELEYAEDDDADLDAEADLVASAELMEDARTSQDAPETPLAENGISEPAEATEAEGPEPALSLSQVITGEAAGEVPAIDDPSDAIQPERGADLASPPAPSNVVGLDGKTYKRSTPKASRRSPLTDSFWRTVHEARKKVESLHRLVEDDRWPQNAEKVAAAHRNDLLRINDLLQQVINSLPAEESTQ